MSHSSGPYAPRTTEPAGEPSTTDVAREQATDVGQHAREAGGQVAQTASDQARQVAAETSRQARDLLGEAQGHVADQASVQQQRAAQQLHSVADELGQMVANSDQAGVATEFTRQAAHRVRGAASWLEERQPADLLDEVRSFARRRPGTFLLGAALAGLAAGRLTRGLKDRGDDSPDTVPGRDAVPGVPAAGPVDPAGPAYPTETYSAPAGYDPGPEPVNPPAPAPAYETETGTAYPADTGYTAETGSPTEPAYPADPVIPDREYLDQPGTTPRFEGPA